MTNHPVIARRIETGTNGSGTSTTRLSETLLSEQVGRLVATTAVAAGLWIYGLFMETVVRPRTITPGASRLNVTIELLGMLLSGLAFLYFRYAKHTPQRKTDIGLVYFVLNAIGTGFFSAWARVPTVESSTAISWVTVVILVAAMIIPTTPRKMLVTTLIAATADPFAMWVTHLRGLETPSLVNTLVLFMPNYACAVVATATSRVLHRLARRLSQAQDMGSYHLVELLGRGGMGEVWRAQHRLLARSAAIKLVRPELLGASSESEAQSMLRRFEREAQATAALSSPHTIRLFDFGVTTDRTFYYVMELLDGRDLESLVREFGPVPANRVAFLLKQVCHSLAEAHARDLIHRDITPANIYVCRMGLDYDFVKVLDFGLVTFADRSMERTLLTGAHTTTGTPAFMAPEVILDGQVDERADVYALGCVAYYLLTGQLVFQADTAMKMFVQHLQTTPIRPSERTEMPIPRDIEAIVMACLEKEPHRRPQNAAVVLRLLEQCKFAENWDNDAAKTWWHMHLAEFTQPLSISERPTELPHLRTA